MTSSRTSALTSTTDPLPTETGPAFHSPASIKASTNHARAREWLARLNLTVDHYQGKSRLSGNASEGPLRLLRPYYPEGQECVHLYLIHPPGGLVCGDNLQVNIKLGDDTKSLITIPSAGKVYRSDALNHPQRQSTTICCGQHTELEWLPQETIVYSGSNGHQSLALETAENSRFILWELTALGRHASKAPFQKGSFRQSMQINLAGCPVFIEKLQLTANSSMFSAPWGLNHFPVYGSMLAGYFDEDNDQQLLTEVRNSPAVLSHTAATSNLQWSATTKDKLLIVRALAQQSEPIKTLFHSIWECCRPELLRKAPHYPRIWAT